MEWPTHLPLEGGGGVSPRVLRLDMITGGDNPLKM